MNCQKWQTAQGVVLVDCGLMFPDDSLLGVDVVIPRLESVFTEEENVLGVILTHGHEDHIGALPWLLHQYKSLRGLRIYGHEDFFQPPVESAAPCLFPPEVL